MCIRDRESIALLFEYEKIRVTSDPKTGRYQLLSGKRLLKICKNEKYEFTLVEAQLIEKQDEDAEDVLIKHAINYCISVSYTHLDVYKRQP